MGGATGGGPILAAAAPLRQGTAIAPSGPPPFQVGDKAVYPGRGVAEIMGIDETPIRCYGLRLLGSDLRIRIPLDKAAQVGLRPVAEAAELREVYQVLKAPAVPRQEAAWLRRHRGLKEKIRTGRLGDVAEVFRDLCRQQTQKALSFTARRLLDTARRLLVQELALAQGHSEARIERELAALLKPKRRTR